MLETPSSSPASTSKSITSELDLSALTADPNNARLHSAENLDMIQASLQELGAGRSILIDENDVILAGNGVAEAAQKAGMTRVQIVEADGDAIIAVRRRNLTPDQKTRLALFDNRTNDLSEFDPLMLAGLQAEGISMDGLWTAGELDALLADLPQLDGLTGNRFPEPSEDYKKMIAGAAAGGAARDREYEEEVRLRQENTQDRQVSPRPPSADTEPYQPPAAPEAAAVPGLDRVAPTAETLPTAGLDRVTPDQETSRAGLFLHFRSLKIPLSAEEGAALDARLAQHRETAGTYYGFIDALLASSAGEQEGKQGGQEESHGQ